MRSRPPEPFPSDASSAIRRSSSSIALWKKTSYRNLVKLIGMCTEERSRCLVYELIPNGSVDSHLHGYSSLCVSFNEEELTEAIAMATGETKDCLCFIEVIVQKDDTSK